MRMIPQLEMSSTYAENVSGSDSDLNDNPLENDEIDIETANDTRSGRKEIYVWSVNTNRNQIRI